MGELERGNLINSSVKRIDYPTLQEQSLTGILWVVKHNQIAFDIFRSAPSNGKKPDNGFS